MRRGLLVLAVLVLFCNEAPAELPREFDRSDRLFSLGLLDVTQTPYSADPAGQVDSTEAIQRAVNDARDNGLVCFFPEGTYLISDTISCEQEVAKLAQPRHVDGGTQHYWPVHRPIIILGSTKGKRPVLELSNDANGFDDPNRPKLAVHIWAQTWFDARGKEEPTWGEEQPNISFNHIFKGIDIDISGHPGAIGIRHSGSQGSTMQDITIHAEGAYAGMNNCCGQGGGTYNVEVIGGRYGIVIEPSSRFPILTACQFTGQDGAAIRYAKGGSQVPTLLVGCRLAPNSDAAIDMTTERGYAGVSMVDCVIDLAREGSVFRAKKPENVFLENTFVRGADSIVSQGTPVTPPAVWTHVRRFSTHTKRGATLINGEVGADRIVLCKEAEDAPSFEELAARHYEGTPSFEDDDVVFVKDFGAKGDGTSDDTEAFREAIAMGDKVFVPSGNYALSGTLQLRPNTHLFGPSRSFTSLGAGEQRPGRGEPGTSPWNTSFRLETVDDPTAAPGLSFITIRGNVAWRSGQGDLMLARAPLHFSGNGGGRFYGVMAMGRPFILDGVRQPTAFYSLNIERVTTNPQSEIRNCENVRVYYFKVEAGTIQRPNAGDANTPCRISNSRDIRVYCMYGNVRGLTHARPMLDVADCRDILVSQLKAFFPADFSHVRESFHGVQSEVPASDTCALFVRE